MNGRFGSVPVFFSVSLDILQDDVAPLTVCVSRRDASRSHTVHLRLSDEPLWAHKAGTALSTRGRVHLCIRRLVLA